jgi:hypothetical protein
VSRPVEPPPTQVGQPVCFPPELSNNLEVTNEGNLWRDLDLVHQISRKQFQKIRPWRKTMFENKFAPSQIELIEIEELENKVAPSGSVPIVE